MEQISNAQALGALRAGAAKITREDVESILKRREELENQFSESGPLRRFLDELKILFSLLQDYWSGNYREVPWGTIAAIAATLVYVVNPWDLVPDFIPGVGHIDDRAVVSICLALVGNDLKAYRSWKLTGTILVDKKPQERQVTKLGDCILSDFDSSSPVAKAFEKFAAQIAGHAEANGAAYQFVIEGDDCVSFYLDLSPSNLGTGFGWIDCPDVTITMSDVDFLAWVDGSLSGQFALIVGKLKVRGDANWIRRIQNSFGREEFKGWNEVVRTQSMSVNSKTDSTSKTDSGA